MVVYGISGGGNGIFFKIQLAGMLITQFHLEAMDWLAFGGGGEKIQKSIDCNRMKLENKLHVYFDACA